jgi:septum formation protein
MKKIILASGSPARKEFLKKFIDDFITYESNYEEDNTLDLPVEELVKKHALGKARDVAGKFDSGIVISADCLVVCSNKVLGKPVDEEDAIRILKIIRGKKVEVLTGVCVIDIEDNKEIVDYEKTDVFMKELSDQEIINYVKTGEPMGKAGAFGIQGKGALIVEKTNGCFYNVTGLPMFRLNEMLKRIGYPLL